MAKRKIDLETLETRPVLGSYRGGVAVTGPEDQSPEVENARAGVGKCGWCTLGMRHSQALHDECLRAVPKRRRGSVGRL